MAAFCLVVFGTVGLCRRLLLGATNRIFSRKEIQRSINALESGQNIFQPTALTTFLAGLMLNLALCALLPLGAAYRGYLGTDKAAAMMLVLILFIAILFVGFLYLVKGQEIQE